MTLELIALHRLTVTPGQPGSVGRIGAATAAQLSQDALDQLERYVSDLDGRDELAGAKATAGWFDPAQPTEIANLRRARTAADFDQASRDAMARLARIAPGNASSGVVLFVREAGAQGKLACLKLNPGRLTRTRVDTTAAAASAALDVARLDDVLPEPRDLRKGALFPSPSGADMRVVDLTTTGDPAGYWVSFLGVKSIRATATASGLATAAVTALESQRVSAARARELVSEQWDAAANAVAPMPPETFVRQVATAAGVDASSAWNDARQTDGNLADSHAVVAPMIAKKVRRVIDLGDGVRVTGPASQVDRRIEEGQDADGWFVKVRATGRPDYRNG